MALAFLSNQCFSHGQLYVAFSRVTTLDGIRVYSPSSTKEDEILNVVYRELIDDDDDSEENTVSTALNNESD